MIDWTRAIKIINYKFHADGVSSIDSYIDEQFGELKFDWEGNRKLLRISFINVSNNCICEKYAIARCKCSWIAFKERDLYPTKIFNKKEVEEILNL